MRDLTQAQWKAQLKNDENAVVLDVRTTSEMEEGYIPGAVQMDIYDPSGFMEAAQALDLPKIIISIAVRETAAARLVLFWNPSGYKTPIIFWGDFRNGRGEP